MPDHLDRDQNLDACLDFSLGHYEAMRTLIINNGSTNEGAIEALTQAWTQQNKELREQWNRQTEEEQANVEAAAQREREQAEQPREEQHQRAEDERVDERLECKKKMKTRFRNFNPNHSVASVLVQRPSTYAINKISSFKYVELWYFMKEGCKDAQSTQCTEADDSLGMSKVGDLVTFHPVASVQASKHALKDTDLTWEQFGYANHSFLRHVDKASWPGEHVQALLQFFVNLENSPYLDCKHGKQIVMTQQACIQRSWMDIMKDGDEEVFNIAIINNGLMESISCEIQSSITANMQ